MPDAPTACCACLTVTYVTAPTEDGHTRGWWACKLCGNKFGPVRAHDYALTAAVAQERAACIAIVEAEPELSEAPSSFQVKMMVETGQVEVARAVVRATKRAIVAALHARTP